MTLAAPACHGSAGKDSRRLLLVGATPQVVRKAVAAGFTVWSLSDSGAGQPEGGPATGETGHAALQADFTDTGALCELIAATARAHDIGGLLTFGAARMLPAVLQTAERLGLCPAPAAATRLLDDLPAVRRLLNRSGHSHVPSLRTESFRQLLEAIKRIGLPVVVTPLPGPAGAHGATPLLPGPGGFGRRAVSDTGKLAEHDGPYLVERPLDGPSYGVETLTVHGMHHVLGITALRNGGPTGHDLLFPAPLGPRERSEIRAAVTELLDLAGFEFGLTHTAVVLTPHGPRIAHAQSHQGEEPIGRMIELATERDPEAELFRALSGEPVTAPRVHRYAYAARFRLPAGLLRSVSGLEQVATLPGFHALHFPYAPGDEIPQTGAGDQGYVLLTADTPNEAARNAAAVHRLQPFEIALADAAR